MSTRSIEDIIRDLDRIEADLRHLEHRCFAVRAALRERVDPFKQRKDLGYWHEEQAARTER